VAEFIESCRRRGVKIGATTGYNREMMELCAQHAVKQNYVPDVSVCADDVPAGRPAPWMALLAAMKLGIYPMESVVKIGDTYADIDEGLNAGMWTVGITRTGNEVGLSEAELAQLELWDLEKRIKNVEERMRQRGAHYVARSVGECLPILNDINVRLARGDRP
jgi:phosphonoacetaldehyde hydrolase